MRTASFTVRAPEDLRGWGAAGTHTQRPPNAWLLCELALKPTVEFTDVMLAGYQHTAVAVHA